MHYGPLLHQRGRFWQAEYWISGVRDYALSLACLRRGLPTAHGRGSDNLPPEVLKVFEGALGRSLEPTELAERPELRHPGFAHRSGRSSGNRQQSTAISA